MKILTTSDWHLGSLFHGNDRLPEHKHFLRWLLGQIEGQQPDALLIAGDVFDNGNPSAAAQSVYYEFLADATQKCPGMQIVITAGNHDSANRLEAPRALLTRHKVEVRGHVHRTWKNDEGGKWVLEYKDLMIPVTGKDGDTVVILAVPYLRNDVVQNVSYSQGVNHILHELTALARERYPGTKLVMMAHMYAKGADIAAKDPSEKIVIGGLEEVSMDGWEDHPDYLTCGHIHKRQHIWNTDWARYTGSVLPMSFAEVDYRHGVDLVTFAEEKKKPVIEFLEYTPQHKLRILPENDEELTPGKWLKYIDKELPDRVDGELGEDFVYLMLKVKFEKVSNDAVKELEAFVGKKNAVLCKIQKIVPALDVSTIAGDRKLQSIDDILDRDPMETLRETFSIRNEKEMNGHQEQMLRELLASIREESDDR